MLLTRLKFTVRVVTFLASSRRTIRCKNLPGAKTVLSQILQSVNSSILVKNIKNIYIVPIPQSLLKTASLKDKLYRHASMVDMQQHK